MEKPCEGGNMGEVTALSFPRGPEHEKWYQWGSTLKLVFLFFFSPSLEEWTISLWAPLLRHSCVSVLRVAQGNRQPDSAVCVAEGSLESAGKCLPSIHPPHTHSAPTTKGKLPGGGMSFHTAILFRIRFIVL